MGNTNKGNNFIRLNMKRTCSNCGNYKEIPKGHPYCEDCCKKLLEKPEIEEIPIIGEIVQDEKLGNKIKYYEKPKKEYK
jgi:hypothetical protein